jgi:hypothetical protein
MNLNWRPSNSFNFSVSPLISTNITGALSFSTTKVGGDRNNTYTFSASSSIPIEILTPFINYRGTFTQRAGFEALNSSLGFGLSVFGLRLNGRIRELRQLTPISLRTIDASYSINSSLPILPNRRNVSVGVDVLHGISQSQINRISSRAFISLRSGISLNLAYQQSLQTKSSSFQFGIRIDLDYASTRTDLRYINKTLVTSSTIRGSLSFDRKFLSIHQNQRSLVGSGALSIVSFMDANGNKTYDKGEKIIAFDGIEIDGCWSKETWERWCS